MGRWLELANRLEMEKDTGDNRDDRDKRADKGAIVPNVPIVPTPLVHNLVPEWMKGVASLDPDTPRGGYDPARWLRLVDDCHALLSGFGQSAASLGWTGIDLFGVPAAGAGAEYPFGGLAWRMKGGRVIFIDEHQAVYRMPFSGIAARCARGFLDRPSGPFVPVWEMEQ